jgi:rare lipoprotein A
MQFSSTSTAHAFYFEWRLGAWILAAALLSIAQGCAIISDAPHQSISWSAALPPEIRNDAVTDRPQTETPLSEIPSTAVTPPARETDEPPPMASLPTPPPATIVETGMASWYGARHHGKRTASGEIFNQEKFTAAHRTLPWGSVVKVTNLANGKSVEVRINDRGPFEKGRIIDLSRAAARVLGMVASGVTLVRVELLSPLDTPTDLVSQSRQ